MKIAVKRLLDKEQQLASTPPLVTDTDPADSSTQVAPLTQDGAIQQSHAHSSLQQAAPSEAVGHDASSSVTQAAHDHSVAINFWLSDHLDTVPHLTADDIRVFTS
jgi:hypothetical protein